MQNPSKQGKRRSEGGNCWSNALAPFEADKMHWSGQTQSLSDFHSYGHRGDLVMFYKKGEQK